MCTVEVYDPLIVLSRIGNLVDGYGYGSILDQEGFLPSNLNNTNNR